MLDTLARRTWGEMEEGARVGLNLPEEVITAVNLQKLLARTRDVWIRPHGRGLEHRTGADWEWWFGLPGAWVGVRVQAKRLYPDLRYRELWKGTPGAPGGADQARRLLAESEFRLWRYATIPVYAFYNWWPAGGASPPQAAHLASVRRALRGSCTDLRRRSTRHGWTIADAATVLTRLLAGPTARTPSPARPDPGTLQPATHLCEHVGAAHSLRCFVAQLAAVARAAAAERLRQGAAQSTRWGAPLAFSRLGGPGAGSPGELFRAAPGGGTWPVYHGPPPYAVAAVAAGNGVAAGRGADDEVRALVAQLREGVERDRTREWASTDAGEDVPDGLAGVAVARLDGAA